MKTGHRASGPYRGKKNTAFEGGHRVPFVVRWAGQVPGGATSDLLFGHTDLLATFAELTGAPLPEDAGEDSFSILSNLLDQGKDSPQRPRFDSGYGSSRAHFGRFFYSARHLEINRHGTTSAGRRRRTATV